MKLTAKYIKEAKWDIRHNDYQKEDVDKLLNEIISDYQREEWGDFPTMTDGDGLLQLPETITRLEFTETSSCTSFVEFVPNKQLEISAKKVEIDRDEQKIALCGLGQNNIELFRVEARIDINHCNLIFDDFVNFDYSRMIDNEKCDSMRDYWSAKIEYSSGRIEQYKNNYEVKDREDFSCHTRSRIVDAVLSDIYNNVEFCKEIIPHIVETDDDNTITTLEE